MNIICIHNPDEENEYLSNWYMSYFKIDGIEFSSMEQYMMYRIHDLVKKLFVSMIVAVQTRYLKLMM